MTRTLRVWGRDGRDRKLLSVETPGNHVTASSTTYTLKHLLPGRLPGTLCCSLILEAATTARIAPCPTEQSYRICVRDRGRMSMGGKGERKPASFRQLPPPASSAGCLPPTLLITQKGSACADSRDLYEHTTLIPLKTPSGAAKVSQR